MYSIHIGGHKTFGKKKLSCLIKREIPYGLTQYDNVWFSVYNIFGFCLMIGKNIDVNCGEIKLKRNKE